MTTTTKQTSTSRKSSRFTTFKNSVAELCSLLEFVAVRLLLLLFLIIDILFIAYVVAKHFSDQA